jgi:hypothetical protein
MLPKLELTNQSIQAARQLVACRRDGGWRRNVAAELLDGSRVSVPVLVVSASEIGGPLSRQQESGELGGIFDAQANERQGAAAR